jgi:hypothetical protein
MNFTTTDTKNWKLLYKVGKSDDKNTKALEEKIKKFIASEKNNRLSYSFDIYTEKENFIAIEGMQSEGYASSIASILKDDKKYKLTEPGIVISNDNYKVVQIKKNLEAYLNPQKNVAVPTQPEVKQPASPQPIVPQTAVDLNSPDDEAPKPTAPPASKAARTKPPGGTPKMGENDVPKTSSTPK